MQLTRLVSVSILVGSGFAQSSGSVVLENTGRATASGSEPQLVGGLVSFDACEAANGVDHNGDGDLLDAVPQLFFVDSGEVRELGRAGSAMLDEESGSILALCVSEAADGATDHNGDGDASDTVLFVHEVDAESTTNLGLALGAGGARATSARVLFTVSEAGSGGIDRNADGDALDSVLFLYDPATAVLTNTRLATNSLGDLRLPSSAPRAFDWVLFGVDEADQGGQDLDGDGQAASDSVVHAVSLTTGDVLNLGIDAFALYGAPNAIDVLVHDRRTRRLHTFDGLTAFCRNLPVQKTLDTAHVAFPAGRSFVYLEPESNVDLNGDGDVDPNDWIPHVVSSTTGTVTRVPLAAVDLAVDLPWVALLVDEGRQDGDLNGDGDQLDRVLHVVELETFGVVNTGLAAERLGPIPYGQGPQIDRKDLRDGFVTVLVAEADLGGDQNGDGDAADTVLVAVECASGEPWSSGAAVEASLVGPELDDGVVWFPLDEAAQGMDANGDGDTADVVPQAWHPCAGSPVTTSVDGGLASSSRPDGQARDSRALLFVQESTSTGDRNADGDQDDAVLHVATFTGVAGPSIAFGAGTPGLHAVVPRLSAIGCASAGAELTYVLEDGLGGMPALLAFGTTPQSLAVLGGTLYLFPFDALQPIVLAGTPGTPGAGFDLFPTGPIDASLVGTTVLTQAAVSDPGGVSGLTLTNAVSVTIGL